MRHIHSSCTHVAMSSYLFFARPSTPSAGLPDDLNMPGVSRVSGRAVARKALLIGIQYENNPTMSQNGQTIPGAHNDPQILRDLLIGTFSHLDSTAHSAGSVVY